MTKKQLLSLRPGDRVEWVEPNTADHGQQGVVRPGTAANLTAYYVQWNDQERVPVHDGLARYLKKLRD